MLVSPTTPFVAFPLGTRTADPYQMYLADLYTHPDQPLRRPGHLGARADCPRGCRSACRSWRRRMADDRMYRVGGRARVGRRHADPAGPADREAP